MSVKKKVLIASLWVFLVYGLSQVLRLGSSLIVTRLLEPEMFGLMVVVNVVFFGLTMFSDLGLWSFIVRHKNTPGAAVLNTVWTIQVIRGWVVFLFLVLSVLVFLGIKNFFMLNIPGVYGENILPYILIAVGFTAIIQGYKTLAPAILSRDLKRGRLEIIELFSQFCGIVVMLAWAFNQSTVWALVSAGIVGSFVELLLIYKLFSYRHHFFWDKSVVKDVVSFAKWIVIASILTYVALQGDKLYFGVYISPRDLGVYAVAFVLAGAGLQLSQQLVSKVWFPVLSLVANKDGQSLKSAYYKIRLKSDLFIFLLAGGMMALGPLLVESLYDVRYHEAGWMVQVLSISLVGEGLSGVGMECLSALTITKYRVKVMLVRSLFLLVGFPFVFYFFGFFGAVVWTAVNVFFGLPVIYMELYRNNIFSFFREVRMLPLVLLGFGIGELIVYQVS